MFISSCPLRVSLFGGSTDNPVFVERYGFGSVISFACNLKTYITNYKIDFERLLKIKSISYEVNTSRKKSAFIVLSDITILIDFFFKNYQFFDSKGVKNGSFLFLF